MGIGAFNWQGLLDLLPVIIEVVRKIIDLF